MAIQRRIFTDSAGTEHLVSVDDVEPVLDANKALQNDGSNGYGPSRDLRRIASIPAIIAEKWLLEDGINVFDPDHAAAVRKKLNDPDYKWLRAVDRL